MKYYTSTTEYNCGIDLHARQMYVCVMDRQGKKLVHCNIKDNDFDYFLKLIKPYRHDITICSECMFGWYGGRPLGPGRCLPGARPDFRPGSCAVFASDPRR
jgi:hypothetical protein